ncbi:calnexin isoform X1 [Phyllobates terribilis]|uniref:calnexin isoform X1 n=1 Tax=Phyllobates terribilis TaxID=111132 RepID=UPI003CCAC1CA
MDLKWLFCLTFLLLGVVLIKAHDGHHHGHHHHQHDHDHDHDDGLDIEDDLDDLIDDEDPTPDASASPPAPKVTYKAPVPTGDVYVAESFDKGTLEGWVLSKAKKDDTDDEIAKYDGKWEVSEMKETKLPGDKGLVLASRAKHHAIAIKLKKPFVFDKKPLIVQYEVNFQSGIECGGAYVKLLSKTSDHSLDQFQDKTPYTIMFGPDKCGEDYKLHFIFRHKNPKTGEYEEKHAKRPDADLKSFFTDKKTHMYTLVLNPDNSFEILVDQNVVNSGNLLTDVNPPVNPPSEIEDPDDRKPEDWDERPKIPDPDAVKPDDWDEDAPAKIPDENAVKPEGWLDDEPEYIADPDAEKPEDWDEDMDGEWEAPQVANPKCASAPGCGAWQRPTIDNPNYKGKWKAPMIDNPNYQGMWKPRKISNPDFFEDLEPFRMTPFFAMGLELWSMTPDIFFDNFIICSDRVVADEWGNAGWGLKKAADGAAEPSVVEKMMSAAEERPWLWIVYILTVALPVFLVILFCCSGKKQTPDASHKKTDAPQPDVKEEEEEEEEKEADKEGEDEAAEDPAEEEQAPEEGEGDAGHGSNEEEEEENDQENEGKPQEDDIMRRSPRNRKPRRD